MTNVQLQSTGLEGRESGVLARGYLERRRRVPGALPLRHRSSRHAFASVRNCSASSCSPPQKTRGTCSLQDNILEPAIGACSTELGTHYLNRCSRPPRRQAAATAGCRFAPCAPASRCGRRTPTTHGPPTGRLESAAAIRISNACRGAGADRRGFSASATAAFASPGPGREATTKVAVMLGVDLPLDDGGAMCGARRFSCAPIARRARLGDRARPWRILSCVPRQRAARTTRS